MSERMPSWRRYLRFWGADPRDDVDEELRFHREMRTREYVARGMTETDARREADRRIGDATTAAVACVEIDSTHERRMRQADLMDSIVGDARYALRSFARTPVWTAVAVATIGLGVGASTSVLSAVDGLLIRPVAYPAAKRIATVRIDVGLGVGTRVWSAPTVASLDAWRRSARSIEAIEGFARRELALTGDLDAEPLRAAMVSETFFPFAGSAPLVGRTFSIDDVQPGAAPVALLGESYWSRAFGGRRDVVGQTLRASGQSFTIIGVAPVRLGLPDLSDGPVDVWIPLPRGTARLGGAVARLRENVSLDAARLELDGIMKRGESDPRFAAVDAKVLLMRPSDTLRFRRALEMLASAVALLLLVACANVAHLTLARGTSRRQELAVRYALGATRSRLVRQLLTESVMLSLAGWLAASTIAALAIAALRAAHPQTLAAFGSVRIDRSVFLIAASLTTSAGVSIGLLVGLLVARSGIADSLRPGTAGAPGRSRLRSTLVVSEIALSATLLVGALLLVRSVIALQSTPSGFDTRHLYAVTLSTRGTQLESNAAKADFSRRLLESMRRVPGVNAAALAESAPFKTGFLFGPLETVDRPGDPANPSTVATNAVSPEFFGVAGIRFVAGGSFAAGTDSRNQIIISEMLARQFWPAQSAVGKRIRMGSGGPGDPPSPWWTVVGVTRDAITHGLTDGAGPVLYTPLDGSLERGRLSVIVRLSIDASAVHLLRQAAASLLPGAPPPSVVNLDDVLMETIAEPRFAMVVLTTFAVLAVVLASIGLYGVIAYSVAQRTREIGIRVTLGATRRAIGILVIREGLTLTCVGIALGIAGALAGTRVIQLTLYGVGPGDPGSYVAGAVALLTVSVAACVFPMLRATAVDPVVAVRAE